MTARVGHAEASEKRFFVGGSNLATQKAALAHTPRRTRRAV